MKKFSWWRLSLNFGVKMSVNFYDLCLDTLKVILSFLKREVFDFRLVCKKFKTLPLEINWNVYTNALDHFISYCVKGEDYGFLHPLKKVTLEGVVFGEIWSHLKKLPKLEKIVVCYRYLPNKPDNFPDYFDSFNDVTLVGVGFEIIEPLPVGVKNLVLACDRNKKIDLSGSLGLRKVIASMSENSSLILPQGVVNAKIETKENEICHEVFVPTSTKKLTFRGKSRNLICGDWTSFEKLKISLMADEALSIFKGFPKFWRIMASRGGITIKEGYLVRLEMSPTCRVNMYKVTKNLDKSKKTKFVWSFLSSFTIRKANYKDFEYIKPFNSIKSLDVEFADGTNFLSCRFPPGLESLTIRTPGYKPLSSLPSNLENLTISTDEIPVIIPPNIKNLRLNFTNQPKDKSILTVTTHPNLLNLKLDLVCCHGDIFLNLSHLPKSKLTIFRHDLKKVFVGERLQTGPIKIPKFGVVIMIPSK